MLAPDIRLRLTRLEKFIVASGFAPLPGLDRTAVVDLPAYRRGDSLATMDPAPPLDSRAIGRLEISAPLGKADARTTRHSPAENVEPLLDVLAMDEGYPGQALQFAYGNLNPSPIRRVLKSRANVEGWPSYADEAMLDQGYGGGDPGLRLTQLDFYLRSVADAILDHKMHCEIMTDDQAMQFLTGQCFESTNQAQMKIITAKQSPCQLSVCFAGRMAHYRLRQVVEREMGAKFSLGNYHRAVLAQGAVPVKYLPELVRTTLGLPH